MYTQGMQQLLDESASDSRDIRYKFMALGEMLKRQQYSFPALPCHFKSNSPYAKARFKFTRSYRHHSFRQVVSMLQVTVSCLLVVKHPLVLSTWLILLE
jgi:hypothetical protein